MSESLVPHRSAPVGPTFDDAGTRPTGAGPAPSPLERPLAAIRRYKWIIVVTTILGAIGGWIATKHIDPSYEVRGSIWVEAGGDMLGRNGGAPMRAAAMLNDNAWVELFQSYPVVDSVVTKLRLYLKTAEPWDSVYFRNFQLDTMFVPSVYELTVNPAKKRWTLVQKETGNQVDEGTPVDSVGEKVGFLWRLPESLFRRKEEAKIEFTVDVPRSVSTDLILRMNPKLMPRSPFIWLTFEDTDGKRAALILNTWMNQYVRVAGELKARNAKEFARILAEQLASAEQILTDADRALEDFKVKTATMPTDAPMAGGMRETSPQLMSGYFAQKVNLDDLKRQREALDTLVAQASRGATPWHLLTINPLVSSNPGAVGLRADLETLLKKQTEITGLLSVYKEDWPQVRQLRAEITELEKRRLPQGAAAFLQQIRTIEAEDEQRLGSASGELQQIPARVIQQQKLERNRTVAEGIYSMLKTRSAEARLTAEGTAADVRISAAAVAPWKPTKNTANMIIGIAILLGVGAGVGLAILLDMLDRKIRYADQSVNELGLIVAGAVPRLPKGGVDAQSPEQVMQLVESFRSLRMHVMASTERPVMFAVTSAGPGDGKSLVSSNLALSFAEAGFRTVLVDGDTRRGALHEMFGAQARPGLTEYLAGTVALEETLQPTQHARLSLVPCGPRYRRSPELLSSQRLPDLVSALRGRFDVVIFDTPPLAAGIDAYAIATAAGSLLMVLRIGKTERRLAAAKLAVADRLPVNVIGSVLNGVHLNGEFQYYRYSAGYGLEEPELIGSGTE